MENSSKSKYQKNKTMQLLGNQIILPLLYENEQQLEDILSANNFRGDREYCAVVDAFNYGIIAGKRIERAKKHKHK